MALCLIFVQRTNLMIAIPKPPTLLYRMTNTTMACWKVQMGKPSGVLPVRRTTTCVNYGFVKCDIKEILYKFPPESQWPEGSAS